MRTSSPADLRRFTTGQLVGAHHYERRTLFARWLARHRAPVTVGVVLATLLVVVATLGVHGILAERDRVSVERDIAVTQSERAEVKLATALYEKGLAAENAGEWPRAAMYYAAARLHHDTPEAAWAAGLAEARAVVPSVRYMGHTAWVHAAAISPDGERVASVDDAGELRVWSPRDGTTFARSRREDRALRGRVLARRARARGRRRRRHDPAPRRPTSSCSRRSRTIPVACGRSRTRPTAGCSRRAARMPASSCGHSPTARRRASCAGTRSASIPSRSRTTASSWRRAAMIASSGCGTSRPAPGTSRRARRRRHSRRRVRGRRDRRVRLGSRIRIWRPNAAAPEA